MQLLADYNSTTLAKKATHVLIHHPSLPESTPDRFLGKKKKERKERLVLKLVIFKTNTLCTMPSTFEGFECMNVVHTMRFRLCVGFRYVYIYLEKTFANKVKVICNILRKLYSRICVFLEHNKLQTFLEFVSQFFC